MTKKGSAYSFIYGLAFLFVIGLLIIVFTQVVNQHMYPLQTTNTDLFNLSVVEQAHVDRVVSYWLWAPVVMIIITLIYWLHSASTPDDPYRR